MSRKHKQKETNYISATTVGWCLLGTLVGCIIFNVVTYSINKYRLEDAVATLTREQIRQDAKIETIKLLMKGSLNESK
jgi:hypothetical protein